MKILHVNKTYFPESVGGIEESIRTLCKNKQHEHKIFCATHKDLSWFNSIYFERIEVYRVKSITKSKALPINFSGVLEFRKLAQWADVIHIHFPWPNADLFSLFLPRGKKVVVTYHSDIERNKFLLALYKPLMKLFFSRVSRIVATSPNYLESSSVLQSYKQKVDIIPLGLKDFSNETIPSETEQNLLHKIGKPFFLFLGVPRKYKGVDYLIQASKSISTSHTVVVAGDGGLLSGYVDYAKEIDATNIVFLGQVDDNEKSVLLKHCLALVLPSILRSEAFGLTLVEGAMFSKPLISTEIGSGMSYINKAGYTGEVIKPRDSQMLCYAMNGYIEDASKAKKHGDHSRERYEMLFQDKKMLKSYHELYEEVYKASF